MYHILNQILCNNMYFLYERHKDSQIIFISILRYLDSLSMFIFLVEYYFWLKLSLYIPVPTLLGTLSVN